MKHKVVLEKCPMCKKECDKNNPENHINFTYNYSRDWKGDGNDGSWVAPRRVLICSICSEKYCKCVGESHLRDHPLLWVFKTDKARVDYACNLNEIALEELASETREEVVKMAKAFTRLTERNNPTIV